MSIFFIKDSFLRKAATGRAVLCRCALATILVAGLLACAPAKPIEPARSAVVQPTEPAPPTPPEYGDALLEKGKELFEKAEQLFNEKWYPQALDAYVAYIAALPSGPSADKALFRVAGIHMALGEYENSAAAYERLLAEHPESPLAASARFELLFALYHAGRYQDVITQAAAVEAQTLTPIETVRASRLLGDTYMALKSPVDAIHFYAMAYHLSEPPERQQILPLIKAAVPQLDDSGILSLLGQLAGRLPSGYLMYQLAQNKIAEQNFDAAIAILSAFIDKYPEHEHHAEAKILLDQLAKNYEFNRRAIGCLLPLSGPYKMYGQRALSAIQFALTRYSRRNPKADCRLIIKDTGSDPDRAANAVRELAAENVAAIMGPLTVIEPAALEAQASGIPIITLTQKDHVPDIGEFVFRNFFTPRMQVRALVSHVIEQLGLHRFAILYPEEPYGRTFMNLFWDEVIAAGGVVTGVESYRPNQTDFADPIKKITGRYYEVPDDLKDPADSIGENSTKPAGEEKPAEGVRTRRPVEDKPPAVVDFDAVFIPDSPRKAGLIIPQLPFYDVNDVYLLGTNLWNSDELIQMAREYSQRAIIPAGFFAGADSGNVRAFVKGFQETFNETPGFIEAVSYDTASMLFELTGRPDILSRTALAGALRELKDFPGVTGLTSFEPNGEVHKQLYLLGIRGNRFIELKSAQPD